MKTRNYILLIIVLAAVAFWVYSSTRLVSYEDTAPVLGPITMRVVIGNDSTLKTSPQQAVQQAFEAARKINNAMSAYQEDSEIAQLNRLAKGERLALSKETWLVMQEAMRYHRLSDGAFDVTVGPLIELYRPLRNLAEGEPVVFPTPEIIAAARARVGSQYLKFTEAGRFVEVIQDGIRVDLGAIAKGFAVDLAVEKLLSLGVQNCLVEIGGETRCTGEHPEGRPWRQAIQDPRSPHDPGASLLVLEEGECALATSGDYQQYFEYQGTRYSHIIDPRSGFPVTGPLVGVTVIAPTCLQADAIATSLSVLGEREAAAFIARFEEQGVKAILQLAVQDGEIQLIHLPVE
ncbi:MAG: FAD:protein FMN transferase [Planctomycetes bacterium]|nr:FAD:protein FMN transferase [Planctomycetota bacterium]